MTCLRLGLLLACCLAYFLPMEALSANSNAGRIKTLKGEAQIIRQDQTIKASLGTEVMAADQIITGPESSVGITLKDDTLMAIGANSRLTLSEYAYDPVTREGRIDASLIKGVLRFVSGLIAHKSPESVAVRTQISTIGIRGTDFIVETP